MALSGGCPCILEIRSPDGRFREGIPTSLVHETVNALADGVLREQLRAWLVMDQEVDVTGADLSQLAAQLAEFAHTNQSELGAVGRLSKGVSGRIVALDLFDGETVSSAVVLSLAIQRLLLVHGLDTEIRLAPNSPGKGGP